MDSRAPSVAAALALVLGSGVGADAQTSLNHTGSGARAAGMANAFIAVSDDGTAASWNPAGLAPLRKPEFSLVYAASGQGRSLAGLRSDDGAFAYSNIESGRTDYSLDFASAAVPFTLGKPITLQAGWHRIYQITSALNGEVWRVPLRSTGEPASTRIDKHGEGNIDVVSLAGALNVTSRLSVGGSFDLWRGRWGEEGVLVQTSIPIPTMGDTPAGTGGPFSEFIFRAGANRVRGHTFTGGLLLTYPSWNVGLVYHAPFWCSFRQQLDTRTNHQDPNTEGRDAPPTVLAAEGRLHFPRSIGAGVAWRPAPRWRVALDLTKDQWTTLLVDDLKASDGTPISVGPISVIDGRPREFSSSRDTLSFNAGAERLFVREGSVIPLRFGLAWEPQGGGDPGTREPISLFMLAGGAGFNTNRFKFDVAVQYRWDRFRGSETFSVPTELADDGYDAVGQARVHEWRVKVSAIYRFQDTEKLRGVLRKIFG